MPSFSQLTTLFLLAQSRSANAFAPPASPNVAQLTRSTTALEMGPPKASVALAETYGEGSRKYRRTVYTHNEWVKHRSSDRFFGNIATMVNSGVYKSLAKEVLATTAVATFLVMWNAFAGGYTDLEGAQHAAIISSLPMLVLPLTPFTLLSPSLGLLLGEFIFCMAINDMYYFLTRDAFFLQIKSSAPTLLTADGTKLVSFGVLTLITPVI